MLRLFCCVWVTPTVGVKLTNALSFELLGGWWVTDLCTACPLFLCLLKTWTPAHRTLITQRINK